MKYKYQYIIRPHNSHTTPHSNLSFSLLSKNKLFLFFLFSVSAIFSSMKKRQNSISVLKLKLNHVFIGHIIRHSRVTDMEDYTSVQICPYLYTSADLYTYLYTYLYTSVFICTHLHNFRSRHSLLRYIYRLTVISSTGFFI